MRDLLPTPTVPVLLDQPPRLGERLGVAEEARPVEVDVGQEERHWTALGDLPDFLEVGDGTVAIVRQSPQPGAGEETTGNVVDRAGAAQTVDGLLDLGGRRVPPRVGVVRRRRFPRL